MKAIVLLTTCVLVILSPLPGQELSAGFTLKGIDYRHYRTTTDPDRSFELRQYWVDMVENLSFPFVPFARADFREYFLYTDLCFFTEHFETRQPGGTFGPLTNYLRISGFEHNLGIGRNFYSAKSRNAVLVQIGLRYCPWGVKSDGIFFIGLTPNDVAGIQSMKTWRTLWSLTWEGNSYAGFIPVIRIGGDLGNPGRSGFDFYKPGFFGFFGIRTQGFRLSIRNREKHF